MPELTDVNRPLRAQRMPRSHVFTKMSLRLGRVSFLPPPSSSFVIPLACDIIKVSHQNRGRVAAADQCSDIFRSSAELKFSLKGKKKKRWHIPERGSRHSVGAHKHVVGSEFVACLSQKTLMAPPPPHSLLTRRIKTVFVRGFVRMQSPTP